MPKIPNFKLNQVLTAPPNFQLASNLEDINQFSSKPEGELLLSVSEDELKLPQRRNELKFIPVQ